MWARGLEGRPDQPEYETHILVVRALITKDTLLKHTPRIRKLQRFV